jgi:hypothetical protein
MVIVICFKNNVHSLTSRTNHKLHMSHCVKCACVVVTLEFKLQELKAQFYHWNKFNEKLYCEKLTVL